MRIVESGAEELASGKVLVGRRNAPVDAHLGRVERFGIAEARQGRAIGAQEEDRLYEVAPRLLDRQRGKVAVVERALGHDAVDGQSELLHDLRECQRRNRAVAAPALVEKLVRVGDGGFAALDCYIHLSSQAVWLFGWSEAARPVRRLSKGPNRLPGETARC